MCPSSFRIRPAFGLSCFLDRRPTRLKTILDRVRVQAVAPPAPGQRLRVEADDVPRQTRVHVRIRIVYGQNLDTAELRARLEFRLPSRMQREHHRIIGEFERGNAVGDAVSEESLFERRHGKRAHGPTFRRWFTQTR